MNRAPTRKNRRRLLQAAVGGVALTALRLPTAGAAPWTNRYDEPGLNPAGGSPAARFWTHASQANGSILRSQRLVTYYGNPWAAGMGILGALSPQQLVSALQARAAQYQAAGGRPVRPVIHMVVTVAQGGPGADGLYRGRMPVSVIGQYAQLAAANGMLFLADVQVGRGTVADEVAAIQSFLEQPHVHLALDPEFDMWGDQVPGQELGHMTAAEINGAQNVLADIAARTGQTKILVVHQFRASMLPDKAAIGRAPGVDLAIVMDGFGGQTVKIQNYDAYVRDSSFPYGGIKLFFDYDAGLLTPAETLALTPPPDIVIYQ
jgi:hypothetical protein